MTRKRKYDANLPKNLTYRKKYNSFYWRNTITGKEIPLGKIARRDAIAQAIEANNYIEKNYSPAALLERIKEEKQPSVSFWIEKYLIILERRELAENTYKIRRNQLKVIEDKIGELLLNKVTTRHIAEFLEPWIETGKNTMAAGLRSTLSDMFREAIMAGYITVNPVEPTRAPKIKVQRERIIDYAQYMAVRMAAEQNHPEWFALAMDLALITGQRREDIVNMRFSDIRDNHLYIEQGKTGARIAIPMALRLQRAELTLAQVIGRCRHAQKSDFLISAGVRKNNRNGAMHPDNLTNRFADARREAGILSDNPPTFHEIRSLAGRMYEAEYGGEFARHLLGHKSAKMTAKYLDSRDGSYALIALPGQKTEY